MERHTQILYELLSDYPGGEFPLFGALKLRSFFHILHFVSAGVGDSQKDLGLDIAPDSRTQSKIYHNPPLALTINVSDTAPSNDVLNIQYKGRYYSIGNSPWDQSAFMILNSLFQSTVTDVSDVGIPITIAK